MDRSKYIDNQYKKLDQYLSDVDSGKIPTGKYVKKAIAKYRKEIKSKKYYFNKKALDRFFHFLSYVKINQEDQYRYFHPEGWQLFYFANIYGIYRKDTNERKYNTSFLTMSKKQGKSTLGAVQSIYHLTSDGQIDGQNYFVSNGKEAAKIALNYTKAITRNSPAINKRARIMQYELRFKQAKNLNVLKVLTADPEKSEGLRGAFVLIDELHTIPTSDLFDSLKSATVGITNPLISIITTRGMNTGYYQYQLETYIKKVIDGKIEDDTIFGLIYELDSEEEIKDPEKWIKSNPNLSNPKILSLDKLKSLYNSAKITLTTLKSFVVKNLNMWYEKADSSFIETKYLDAVFVDEIPEEIIAGEECYLGGDFSSNRDISAISLVFPPSINHSEYIIKNFNWKTLNDISRNHKDITDFILSGEIVEQDSEVMDMEIIFQKIKELNDQYFIKNFGYDSANALQLIKQVKDELGIECTPVPQNAKTLNYPLKFLERYIIDGQIICDNMATKWQFTNVVLWVDSNGNYKAMKDKSKSSIDSVIANTCALAVHFNDLNEDELNYVSANI